MENGSFSVGSRGVMLVRVAASLSFAGRFRFFGNRGNSGCATSTLGPGFCDELDEEELDDPEEDEEDDDEEEARGDLGATAFVS